MENDKLWLIQYLPSPSLIPFISSPYIHFVKLKLMLILPNCSQIWYEYHQTIFWPLDTYISNWNIYRIWNIDNQPPKLHIISWPMAKFASCVAGSIWLMKWLRWVIMYFCMFPNRQYSTITKSSRFFLSSVVQAPSKFTMLRC